MERIPTHATDHSALDDICRTLRAQRNVAEATLAQRRFAMEAMQLQLALPDAVTLVPTMAHTVEGTWTLPSGETTSNQDRDPNQPAVLYFHGGGYSLGSIVTHRELIARIALASGVDVLGINYRLAPEDPYPAAVDDATEAYRWLLAQGTQAKNILLAGDSAGGGLALATLLRLRDAGDPLPSGAVLLSPWTDLTASSDSFNRRKEADPMVKMEGLRTMAEDYAKGRLEEPEVSPLFADLSGLPPMLVQVGDAEILLDDSLRLAKRLTEADGLVTLQVFERMIHVFQAFPSLPEAHQATDRIGTWVKDVLGTASA